MVTDRGHAAANTTQLTIALFASLLFWKGWKDIGNKYLRLKFKS